MSERVVHLGEAGRPACGFHRWGSEQISTTRSPAKVTCRRHGCAPSAGEEAQDDA